MHTISKTPMPLKLLGAFAALALLAVAALAVALTTGQAAAQSPDNIYADPQPCGPGAATAYQLIRYAGPHSVQIVVANDAQLDYETKASYDLTLGVTDNVDHEHNADDSLDDTLSMRIDLTDVPTTAFIEPDNWHPVAGDTVTFTAVLTDFGEGQDVIYRWSTDSGDVSEGLSPTYSIQHANQMGEGVHLSAAYQVPDGPSGGETIFIDAPSVTIHWRSP